jgi:hypothetical protein
MVRKKPLGEPGTVVDEVMARMHDLTPISEELFAFSEGMRALSEMTPARISMRQALAFMFVAQAKARGWEITMSQVRDYFESAPGDANVGQSMAKSFQVFFGPQNDYDGLNWVYQTTDREDRRKKYLDLTSHGAKAAGDIIAAMHNAKETYRELEEAKQKEARKED